MSKKGLIGIVIAFVLLIVVVGGFYVSTHNKIIGLEEGVNKSWSNVQTDLQRRLDLIPNLVSTVKGYASHEKETLSAVTQARAKMGGMVNLKAEDLKDPAKMAELQQAEAGLSRALQRLMVVQERYPDLKANQNFTNLQVQLEGTENRISFARKKFNESVTAYNTYIRSMPASIIAGMMGAEKRAAFKAAAQAEKAPEVKF